LKANDIQARSASQVEPLHEEDSVQDELLAGECNFAQGHASSIKLKNMIKGGVLILALLLHSIAVSKGSEGAGGNPNKLVVLASVALNNQMVQAHITPGATRIASMSNTVQLNLDRDAVISFTWDRSFGKDLGAKFTPDTLEVVEVLESGRVPDYNSNRPDAKISLGARVTSVNEKTALADMIKELGTAQTVKIKMKPALSLTLVTPGAPQSDDSGLDMNNPSPCLWDGDQTCYAQRPYLLFVCHSAQPDDATVSLPEGTNLLNWISKGDLFMVRDAEHALVAISIMEGNKLPRTIGGHAIKVSGDTVNRYPCMGESGSAVATGIFRYNGPEDPGLKVVHHLLPDECLEWEDLMNVVQDQKVDLFAMMACRQPLPPISFGATRRLMDNASEHGALRPSRRLEAKQKWCPKGTKKVDVSPYIGEVGKASSIGSWRPPATQGALTSQDSMHLDPVYGPLERLVRLGNPVDFDFLAGGQVLNKDNVQLLYSIDISKGPCELATVPVSLTLATNLRNIDFSACNKLHTLPKYGWSTSVHLKALNVRGTAIEIIPDSLWDLPELKDIDISECGHLKLIPGRVFEREKAGDLTLHLDGSGWWQATTSTTTTTRTTTTATMTTKTTTVDPVVHEKLGKELWDAALAGDSDTATDLIQAGANLEYQNPDHYDSTPLMTAAYDGHLAVAEALIKARANLESKDKSGNKPLISAAWNGHLDIVEVLVEAGAEINVENDYGHTPLFLAEKYKRNDVVAYLRDHGGTT